jgi:VWFA-related protein
LIVLRRIVADREKVLQPTDRVAIYTTSGIGMLDFTDDTAKIKEALDRIQPMVARDNSLDCPVVTPYQADLMLNYHEPTALSAAITDAFACAQILNVGSLPAGEAQNLAQNMAQASAGQALARSDQMLQQTVGTLNDIVRRMSMSPGQRTIVLLSPGFLVTTNYRYEESDLLDRAIRANVVINSLDARGLYTFETGADGSGGQAQFSGGAAAAQAARVVVLAPADVARARFQHESALADENVLAEVADGTGGTFFRNNNDYAEGLRSSAAAPEFIYLLGFSPQNLKYDGSFHNLKVTLKPKDLNMQARRGYYAPRRAVNAEEQAKQEIREAMFSREEVQEFGVELKTQFFKPTNDTARLSVLTHVDVKNLRFQKAEGVNNDDLTVVAGLFDRNGNMLSAIKKIVFMKLPQDTLAVRMGMGVAVKTNFDVQPGKYVLRVVVRDSEGQMMSARNAIVEIP